MKLDNWIYLYIITPVPDMWHLLSFAAQTGLEGMSPEDSIMLANRRINQGKHPKVEAAHRRYQERMGRKYWRKSYHHVNIKCKKCKTTALADEDNFLCCPACHTWMNRKEIENYETEIGQIFFSRKK